MKNIFRKAVQKVRETAAKVVDTIESHPELILAGVGAVVIGTATGLAIRESRKTAATLNECHSGQYYMEGPDGLPVPCHNVETVLDAVQNVYDAFKAGYEADPDGQRINLVKYGMTRESALTLHDLGLCPDPIGKRSAVYLYLEVPKQDGATETDA